MTSTARVAAVTVVESVMLLYLSTLHSELFGVPHLSSVGQLLPLLLLYSLSVALLSEFVAGLVTQREEIFGWVLWLSVPMLMISGVSLPEQHLPTLLRMAGALLPSTPAIEAYVRMQSMGAGLSDVMDCLSHLMLLSVLYMMLKKETV